MPSASAASISSSLIAGCIDVPRSMTGPEPKWCLPDLGLVDPRRVGRVRDVDGDREPGPQAVRHRPRAVEPGLLLHGGDGDHVAGRAAGLGDEPRGLERDVAAEAIVHRARGDAAVRQLDRIAVDHGHVADPHERARLVAVLGADVDVQLLELGHLLAVVVP